MDTFNPGYAPSMGSEATFTARVLENKFGDGYRQTFPDGLNCIVGSVPLTWSALPIGTAAAMDTFLRGNVGKPFFYQLPRETTPRIWDCKSWKRGWPSGGYDSFSATFDERFDLY